MKRFKNIFIEILSAIYPNKCVCCQNILDNQDFLCNSCNIKLERMDLNNICLNCGLEKDNCVCKYHVFRFNSLVCCFKNTGYAKNIYYSYKFGRKQIYADFFTKELCVAVNKCYGNIKFDLICTVPSFYRFGYDHSRYIAEKVSKKLCIPFDKKLLKCVKNVKAQHKSTFKERSNNVDGKYMYNHKVKDKNILLIDDIKTTGSTLDECAKVLLYAGAKNVYCITALGTFDNKQ